MTFPRQPLTVDFRSPVLAKAYRYWASIGPGGRLPARRDIDPLDIPSVLPNLALIDVVGAERRLRYRLIGSTLVDAIGHDPTGRFLDEVYPDFNESPSHHYRDEVARTGRPSYRHGRASLRFSKDFATVERLYLPLAEDGESVDMILSVIAFELDLVEADA